MPTVVLIVVAVLLAIAAVGCSCRAGADTGDARESEREKNVAQFAPSLIQGATRAQIAKQLDKLTESKPKDPVTIYATCYLPAMPPKTADYVCPVCSNKTLYAYSEAKDGAPVTGGRDGELVETVLYGISECRRAIKAVKGLNVSLYERQFCSKCEPSSEKPKLGLVVKYPDGKEVTTWDITRYDIEMLTLFLEGKDRSVDFAGSEDLLKRHLPRLREILGEK